MQPWPEPADRPRLPAGQSVQDAAPASEYRPAGHKLHAALLPGSAANSLAPQASHAVFTPLVVLWVPGKQGRQTGCPVWLV